MFAAQELAKAVQYHRGSVVVAFNYSDPCFARLFGAMDDQLIFN
jgi:hypothetical protein